MKKFFKNKYKLILFSLIILVVISVLVDSCKTTKFSYHKGLEENAEYLGEIAKPHMKFEYNFEDTNLVLLREMYNLDSVAGKGSEIDKITNLMLWVHNLSTHAPNPSWPTTINSLNIIDLCLNENKSLNCYMYATVLNEVYLSMGFYSRFIHLRYTQSGESHVVNAVFSKTYNKWLMMDADFGAYFMDKDRTILSLPEIRRGIINREDFLFNKELEYSGSEAILKAIVSLRGIENIYPWYFSKNIFKYSTHVISEFNMKTDRTADVIQLIPTNYSKLVDLHPRKRKFDSYDFYYTDDENFFWQSPMDR